MAVLLAIFGAACSTDPVAEIADRPPAGETTTTPAPPSNSPGTTGPPTSTTTPSPGPGNTTPGANGSDTVPPPPTVTPAIPGSVNAPGMVAYVDADGVLVLDRPSTGILDPGRVSPPFTFATQPTWAPDGNQLAWLTFGANDRLARVQLFSLTDGPFQTLTPTFVPIYLSWSPASDNLGLLGGNGTSVLFGFSRAQDVNIVPAADQGEQYYFSWLAGRDTVLSYDGSTVAEVSAGGPTPLVDSAAAFQAPVALDDGTAIISVDDATAGQVVARLDLESGAVTPLASHDGQVFLVGAPDGSELAVVHVPQSGGGAAINPISFRRQDPSPPAATELPTLPLGLSLIDLTTGEVTETPIVGAEAVFYSPDSTRLLVQATDEITQWLILEDNEISLATEGFIPTPTFNQTVLPFFDQYAQSMTPWAPDGTAFVYARLGPGGGQIIVQSATDGRSQVLGSGEYAAWSPTDN